MVALARESLAGSSARRRETCQTCLSSGMMTFEMDGRSAGLVGWLLKTGGDGDLGGNRRRSRLSLTGALSRGVRRSSSDEDHGGSLGRSEPCAG